MQEVDNRGEARLEPSWLVPAGIFELVIFQFIVLQVRIISARLKSALVSMQTVRGGGGGGAYIGTVVVDGMAIVLFSIIFSIGRIVLRIHHNIRRLLCHRHRDTCARYVT
jgi:hypothetical protein